METKTTLTSLTSEKSTRRVVLGTGLKLGYAAPLVAASFKLSSIGTLAKPVQCCTAEGKVGVCHVVEGKGELGNGYNFICIDESAVETEGHNNHETKDGRKDIFPVKCSDECGGGQTVSLY